ncbi:hypothetical protein EGW08_018946 [Elysia chlorotica]|uniref:C-type lectin domain-containing protein n=1 Tax=Elysia chlorotica TaxID=188477 RepID=A0A433SVH5_ELYCH|nr:hypothetical protein EGW08_018946 [Elysia chlorotica]
MCAVALLCLLAITGAVSGSGTIEDSCPAALLGRVDIYYLQVWESSCFYFGLSDKKSYSAASAFCKEDGGTLAMPKSKSLNDFLTNQVVSYYGVGGEFVWIGLDDKKNESAFIWADDTKMTWDNFAPQNGPSNIWIVRDTEDCAAMDDQGLWHDHRCVDNQVLSWAGWANSAMFFICQYTIGNR